MGLPAGACVISIICGVEDGASIQVRAGDGVIGKADVSWSLSTGRNSYVKVHGSLGTVEVGWQSGTSATVARALRIIDETPSAVVLSSFDGVRRGAPVRDGRRLARVGGIVTGVRGRGRPAEDDVTAAAAKSSVPVVSPRVPPAIPSISPRTSFAA